VAMHWYEKAMPPLRSAAEWRPWPEGLGVHHRYVSGASTKAALSVTVMLAAKGQLSFVGVKLISRAVVDVEKGAVSL